MNGHEVCTQKINVSKFERTTANRNWPTAATTHLVKYKSLGPRVVFVTLAHALFIENLDCEQLLRRFVLRQHNLAKSASSEQFYDIEIPDLHLF